MMFLLLLACAAPPTPAPHVLPDVDDLPVQEDPPDPFVSFFEGLPVETEEDWGSVRAPELQELFAHYVYGFSAAAPEVVVEERARYEGALGGAATALELGVSYGFDGPPPLDLLLFLPADAAGPLPVVVGPNKCGNHSVSDTPEVSLPESPTTDDCDGTEAGRGSQAGYWDIRQVLSRGWALATFHQSDIDPDDPDDDQHLDGIHPWFEVPGDRPPEVQWGTIAAWAWGVSRAVDALETRAEIDPTQITAFGHSRRGKTALWAAACDPRIDRVWAHQSGIGGAALSRGSTGETVGVINTLYPHWFDDLFPEFSNREELLPVDQHLLLALIAPRPLLVTDGEDDLWANPEGARQAVELAEPVYTLLLEGDAPLRWSLRPGEHEVTPEDWTIFLDFAEEYF